MPASKIKLLLDDAMEILGMTPMHLLSSGGTRMAHFLVACVTMKEMIVPLYHAMYTKGIREEEREKFLTATNLFVLFLIADTEKIL